jgi:hypothetical protein
MLNGHSLAQPVSSNASHQGCAAAPPMSRTTQMGNERFGFISAESLELVGYLRCHALVLVKSAHETPDLTLADKLETMAIDVLRQASYLERDSLSQ